VGDGRPLLYVVHGMFTVGMTRVELNEQLSWRLWVPAPSEAPCCFLEQETLPLLLSTGWFQERDFTIKLK